MRKLGIAITTFSGRLPYFIDFWQSAEDFIFSHNSIDFLISDESEDTLITEYLTSRDICVHSNIKYIHHENRIGQMNQYYYSLKNLNTQWVSIIEDDNIFYGLSNFVTEIEKLDINTYSLYVSAGVSDYSKEDALHNVVTEFFGSRNYKKVLGDIDGLEIFKNFWELRKQRAFSIDTNYMIYNKNVINDFFNFSNINDELFIRPVITAIDHLLFKHACLNGKIFLSKFPKMYKSQNEYCNHSFKYKISNNIFSNYFVLYFIYEYCMKYKKITEVEINKWLQDGWDFLMEYMINYSMNDIEKRDVHNILTSNFNEITNIWNIQK